MTAFWHFKGRQYCLLGIMLPEAKKIPKGDVSFFFAYSLIIKILFRIQSYFYAVFH